VVIRDPANQQQDIADLSRDTDNANGSIGPIFDKEKEQNRLKEAQLIGEIGGQAADIARTQGQIVATKAANEKMKDVKPEDLAVAEAQWKKANPGKEPTSEDISKQVYQTAYDKAFNESGFGTGGQVQRAIQAATAAVQGLAGGDMAAALANGTAPYITKLIADSLPNDPAARTLAHAAVNAALAAAQGNNALVGAGGAVTGELLGMIAVNAYGKPVSELSESEKQTVSALATLAAGLAGGLIGDSTADVAAGAQTGKTVVENNFLSATQSLAFDKEMQECKASGGDCSAVLDKYKKLSDEQSAALDNKLEDNPLEVQVFDKEQVQGGLEMADRPGWMGKLPGVDAMTSEEAKAYVQQWNSQDLANIDVNSPGWTKFAAFASDPENQAVVASLGMLGKELVTLAKTTVSNISKSGVSTSIKSMQVGLRDPQQVDQIKGDMLSGNYRFTAPEGRIAGYVDSKGNYYISEGNHRMVAAQEIYKKTGDTSYIEKLLQNGSWTQTKKAPAGAKSMPSRK
jgi:filamentous hemagglutinin